MGQATCEPHSSGKQPLARLKNLSVITSEFSKSFKRFQYFVSISDHEAKLVALQVAFQFGWGSDQGIGGFGEEPGIKAQLKNLIRSIRTVMRVPLIALNSVTIVLLLLFG
ncbi:PREDICTED: immediate early response 3-interacting protein 1 [Acanthisitta chloris]|uniref:immediate early response 3-interacting protein 1 n=1 Tax=Acanthisitta chloris TaxID=57068 RepID=UPI0004F0E0A9|nr:PREDICTED: immediate early response 3-interacting protein 1 [Acanthisitta chloris]